MSIILTPPAENFLMHLIYKSALFITLEVHIGRNKNVLQVKNVQDSPLNILIRFQIRQKSH